MAENGLTEPQLDSEKSQALVVSEELLVLVRSEHAEVEVVDNIARKRHVMEVDSEKFEANL